jgi:hypothetical protein
MKVYFRSSIIITPAIAVASFTVPVFPPILELGFGRLLPDFRRVSFSLEILAVNSAFLRLKQISTDVNFRFADTKPKATRGPLLILCSPHQHHPQRQPNFCSHLYLNENRQHA